MVKKEKFISAQNVNFILIGNIKRSSRPTLTLWVLVCMKNILWLLRSITEPVLNVLCSFGWTNVF